MEQLEEQVPQIPNPTSTSGPSVDDLVERVTNAVLVKLQTHLKMRILPQVMEPFPRWGQSQLYRGQLLLHQ